MLTVQTPVQYKENSLTRIYLYQSLSNCYKHCYNCETVTLLNTCEKLKVTDETQRDLENKSKVNEACCCDL